VAKEFINLRVAIIIAFYDGNKYIEEQLKSIFAQTHKNIKIFIFDDNSKNSLKKFLVNFNKKNSFISIIKREENVGYAKNFLYGIRDIHEDFDYYAFCDQDDIWEKDKIEIGLKSCQIKKTNNPKLYFSRTAYYNSDCTRQIGESKKHKKAPIFKNALVQNIAGGNTILINKKGRDILCNSLISEEYTAHDWWSYQVISGVNGEIILSNEKTVKYRQHKENIVGLNNSFKGKINRLKYFFSGEYKNWCNINIKNLYLNKDLISTNNLETLNYFSKAIKSTNIIEKIKYFKKSGVYRQSTSENIILIIGLLLNKV
tara:strand:+ start:155 stop:1096 length:942 start_codon:yes stop_codon:yes gene_type:complete